MLESIQFKNVGPAPEMSMDLAPRLNLLTGDNGLGKTVLLDGIWWALARTWPLTWGGKGIVPEKEGATLDWIERRHDKSLKIAGHYDFADSIWKRGFELDTSTGAQRGDTRPDGSLVVYLRVDGGISVHDPLRTGHERHLPFAQEARGSTNAFQFRDVDIWDGLELRDDKRARVCEGLVRDVVRWAVEAGSSEFATLANLIEQLAGEEQFRLTHKVGRVFVDDARDFPFIAGPAGEVPVAFAPAGLRRILSLAYVLVWTWREHRIAATLKKRPPSTSLVLIIDEVESHLHPKWQRTILPSILRAVAANIELQVIATTHSPMVLASVEPVFEVERDKLFVLDLDDGVVHLDERAWSKQGDVINWLVSDSFGLQQARSLEAEKAIEAAEAWMRGDLTGLPPHLASKEAIHAELQRVLPGHDTFWPRWVIRYEAAETSA